MENTTLTKQQKFLWIVQTMILANGINLASQPECSEKYRHCFSANGVFILTDEASRASELIPKEMHAPQAAHEFCTYMFHNLRDTEEEARHSSLEVPSWFARPSMSD